MVSVDSAAGFESKTIDDLRVGESCEHTKLVSMDDIRKFAEISGDYNPIHTDAAFARQSQFGRCIAHGPLALGLAGGIIGTRLPGLGTIAISSSIRHRFPIYAGDRITTRVSVVALDKERLRAALSVVWTNQDGRLVADGDVSVKPPLRRVSTQGGQATEAPPDA